MIQPRRKQSGQTLIEYAMLMFVVVGLYAVINYQVSRGIGKLWKMMAREIAAPCPTCPPPDDSLFR